MQPHVSASSGISGLVYLATCSALFQDGLISGVHCPDLFRSSWSDGAISFYVDDLSHCLAGFHREVPAYLEIAMLVLISCGVSVYVHLKLCVIMVCLANLASFSLHVKTKESKACVESSRTFSTCHQNNSGCKRHACS